MTRNIFTVTFLKQHITIIPMLVRKHYCMVGHQSVVRRIDCLWALVRTLGALVVA
jgi:hypothetical protein